MEDIIECTPEQRWRLILGKDEEEGKGGGKGAAEEQQTLTEEQEALDETLEALYNPPKKGGLEDSMPRVNRWLGDIRKYFPSTVVQVMQKDAFERLNIEAMLLEPELLESLEPDVNLVATLLSLNNVIPSKTKATARLVVQAVVDQLLKKLEAPLYTAVKGALNRSVRKRRPRSGEINWQETIRRNLKHYQPDYNTIIPHELIGFGRKGQSLKEVILCVDQSGSMASSLVYASVFGAVMASVPALKTHMIVFDTAVVDLTQELTDPVELLFGTQLGGGTDINKAFAYVQQLIRQPSDTIVVLISDLYEGGKIGQLLQRAQQIKQSGAQLITLLALSDDGAPAYDRQIAAQFSALEIPVFACTPDHFSDMMAAAIKQEDLHQWAGAAGLHLK